MVNNINEEIFQESILKEIDVADTLFRSSDVHLIKTILYSSLILFVVVAVNVQFETHMYTMTTEHSVISDLGVVAWGITIVICFFTASLVKKAVPKVIHQFLIISAFLSLYLMLDDFLQFHEVLFYKYLNVPEKIYYAVLAAVVAVYLYKEWPVLIKTNVSVFFLSGACLSLSVLGDGILKGYEVALVLAALIIIIFLTLLITKRNLLVKYLPVFAVVLIMSVGLIYLYPRVQQPEYLIEEGLKWLGIASWCSYFMHTSYHFIRGSYAGN